MKRIKSYDETNKTAIGFKKALFGFSCLFLVPLKVAIYTAILPLAFIFGWPASIMQTIESARSEGIQPWASGLFGFVTFPLIFVISALFIPCYTVQDSIDYGRTIGTEKSTASSFVNFVFKPIICLFTTENFAEPIFEAACSFIEFMDAKFSFTELEERQALLPHLSQMTNEDYSCEEEQQEPNRQTNNMINKAKNENKVLKKSTPQKLATATDKGATL